MRLLYLRLLILNIQAQSQLNFKLYNLFKIINELFIKNLDEYKQISPQYNKSYLQKMLKDIEIYIY